MSLRAYKNLTLNDFKRMLSYTDAAAASAVTVMGNKEDTARYLS